MAKPHLRTWGWSILFLTIALAAKIQAQEVVATKIESAGTSSEVLTLSVRDAADAHGQRSQTSDKDPAAALTDWVKALDTLEATVVQQIYANGTLLEESRGRFAMAPPLLLWQIYEPFPQTILLDEERLQIYDQDLGQLTIQSLSNASGPMPADLLLQPDQLVNGEYAITRQIHGDEHTYRLAPRASSSLFQALDIVLTEGVLTSLSVYDWQGQHTRLLFERVLVNQPQPLTQFQLVVPEGTDVIRG